MKRQKPHVRLAPPPPPPAAPDPRVEVAKQLGALVELHRRLSAEIQAHAPEIVKLTLLEVEDEDIAVKLECALRVAELTSQRARFWGLTLQLQRLEARMAQLNGASDV